MKKFKITIKYTSTTEEVHYVCADSDIDAINIIEDNSDGDCALISSRSNSNRTHKVEEVFEESKQSKDQKTNKKEGM